MKLTKTTNPDFCRDSRNNALINTNVGALVRYKQQRQQNKTIEDLKEEVDELKDLVKLLLKDKR